MKKSILIGAIAALMLFAFVACDQNGANVEASNPVVRLYQDNEVELLSSEVPTFDDFVIMAQRLDGSTFQVSEDDVEFKVNSTAVDTDAADMTVATASYILSVYDSVSVDLKADVYKVTGLTVKYNGTSFDQYYAGVIGTKVNGEIATPNNTFHKDQYVVTAKFGEDQERVLAADEYYVNALDIATTGNTSSACIVTDLDKDGKEDTYSATTYATGLVAVYDPLSSISIAYTNPETGKIIAGAASTEYDDTALKALFTVTGSYESGKEVAESTATLNFAEGTVKESKLPATGSVTVEAAVGTVKTSQSFDLTSNYITSIKEVKKPTNVQAGAKVNVTVTANWASNTAPKTADDELVAVVYPTNMPTYAVANQDYPFTVTIQGHSEVAAQLIMVTCGAASVSGTELN